MRDHFSYLVDDDAGTFFRKVAVDEAGVKATEEPVRPMVKVAAATPFEKVAARIDRDLEYLQLAGTCGLDAGMTKRADAYIDVLFAHGNLAPSEFDVVFDKVAAAAIEADVRAAHAQLCAELPAEEHGYVDDVLIKVGHQMTELALLEKEAFLGEAGLAAARRIGRVLSGAAGGVGSTVKAGLRGLGRAGKVVGREVGTAVAAPFKAVARGAKGLASEYRAGRRAAIMGAPEKLQSKIDVTRAAAARGGALRKPVAESMASSFEEQLGKAEAKRTALAAREAQGSMAKSRPGFGAPGSTTAGGAQEAAKATKLPKTEGGHAEPAQAKKTEGAPPEPETPAKATKTESKPEGAGEPHAATPPPPGGASGKPPGFMDAWKKATTSGWKSLSEGERGTLIRGGVTGALVYRAATGKGAVTGGEGVI